MTPVKSISEFCPSKCGVIGYQSYSGSTVMFLNSGVFPIITTDTGQRLLLRYREKHSKHTEPQKYLTER